MNTTQLTTQRRASKRHKASRAAFAAAILTFVTGVFASVGGVGYAASGGTHAVHAVTHARSVLTAAKSQYNQPKVTTTKKPGAVLGAKTTPKATVTTKGTLPFTGMPLGIASAIGLLLLGAGILLRRTDKNAA